MVAKFCAHSWSNCTCKRVEVAGPQSWDGLSAASEAPSGWATVHGEKERPGPSCWQGWPWGAAVAGGGRRLHQLEGTRSVRIEFSVSHAATSCSSCACDGISDGTRCGDGGTCGGDDLSSALVFASWRRISCATSGMTSIAMVWPFAMPRMRYAPCAKSRKTM